MDIKFHFNFPKHSWKIGLFFHCFGEAFDPIHHRLGTNISSRILQLTESGELYEIQKQWFPYYESYCSNQSMSDSSQLCVRQFWGLRFIVCLVLIKSRITSLLERYFHTSINIPTNNIHKDSVNKMLCKIKSTTKESVAIYTTSLIDKVYDWSH